MRPFEAVLVEASRAQVRGGMHARLRLAARSRGPPHRPTAAWPSACAAACVCTPPLASAYPRSPPVRASQDAALALVKSAAEASPICVRALHRAVAAAREEGVAELLLERYSAAAEMAAEAEAIALADLAASAATAALLAELIDGGVGKAAVQARREWALRQREAQIAAVPPGRAATIAAALNRAHAPQDVPNSPPQAYTTARGSA